MLAAVASGVATATLGLVSIRILLHDPTSFVPGQKLPRRGSLALLAMIEAICIPAYWATLRDAETDMSAPGVAFVAFVLFPALIVPLIRLGMRRGWRWITQMPTCPRCSLFVSQCAGFCGHCGTRQP